MTKGKATQRADRAPKNSGAGVNQDIVEGREMDKRKLAPPRSASGTPEPRKTWLLAPSPDMPRSARGRGDNGDSGDIGVNQDIGIQQDIHRHDEGDPESSLSEPAASGLGRLSSGGGGLVRAAAKAIVEVRQSQPEHRCCCCHCHSRCRRYDSGNGGNCCCCCCDCCCSPSCMGHAHTMSCSCCCCARADRCDGCCCPECHEHTRTPRAREGTPEYQGSEGTRALRGTPEYQGSEGTVSHRKVQELSRLRICLTVMLWFVGVLLLLQAAGCGTKKCETAQRFRGSSNRRDKRMRALARLLRKHALLVGVLLLLQAPSGVSGKCETAQRFRMSRCLRQQERCTRPRQQAMRHMRCKLYESSKIWHSVNILFLTHRLSWKAAGSAGDHD